MSLKQIAIVAALVIVIAAAIFVTARRGTSSAKMPDAVLKAPVTLVLATGPYTVKDFPEGELLKLSKDPATGWYKITGQPWSAPHECYSCKQMIPQIRVPPGTDKPGLFLAKQICPKCGKQSYENP